MLNKAHKNEISPEAQVMFWTHTNPTHPNHNPMYVSLYEF